MLKQLVFLFATLALFTISGCTEKPTVEQSVVEKPPAAQPTAEQPTVKPPTVDRSAIDALALEIRKLGPEVDPAEAERAARIAFTYSAQLATEYRITDSPLLHNYKIHNGYRERGFCVHWAEDIEKRLKQENFRTLTLHRALAPPSNIFRIEHASTIISRRGDTMSDGIVLDGWRYGGALFWSPTLADSRYNWRPQNEVLEETYRSRKATREAAMNL